LASFVSRAKKQGAKLICFPEGFLQGYSTDGPKARRVALELSTPTFSAILQSFPKTGPMIVLGMIEIEKGRLYNTAVVVERGYLVGRYRKAHLLNGESAFYAGTETPGFRVHGLRFGINICNDTNFPEAARKVADGGASLIICPANNMMLKQKAYQFKDVHNAIRAQRCRETGLWLMSSDVTGEQDGRIALGPTAVLNPLGEVAAQLPLGKPGLLIFDLPIRRNL
jgi:predicted amidohydrolase